MRKKKSLKQDRWAKIKGRGRTDKRKWEYYLRGDGAVFRDRTFSLPTVEGTGSKNKIDNTTAGSLDQLTGACVDFLLEYADTNKRYQTVRSLLYEVFGDEVQDEVQRTSGSTLRLKGK